MLRKSPMRYPREDLRHCSDLIRLRLHRNLTAVLPSTLLPTRPLRRHTLVWLSHAPRPELPADASLVDEWHAGGNPFIVCRRRCGSDDISLGFCLATTGRRPRRIAVRASYDRIVRTGRPPALAEFTALEPATFVRFSAAAAEAQLDIRVFGSWMWQVLTGSRHVKASSDLDVLIDVATSAEAGRAVTFLELESANCPRKLDGELSIPGLGEVQWREYLKNEPVLLVKSIDGVRMLPREDLWK